MVPATISHYEVLEKLGEGGMGAVYRARDLRLDRLVALKILPTSHAGDPIRRARLEREAKAASALNHPNIVTIYDVGSDGEHHYIAMEYVRGKTLWDLVGPNGMGLTDALNYARQIASALAAAHEAGIVHRDLKPTNIMVTEAGLVKLLDFGLAQIQQPTIDEDSPTGSMVMPLTRAGTIVGTVAYMSPEQVEGKELDQRSDIFSFGIVLYQMLTGELPFQGSSEVGLMYAIAHSRAPSATQARRDLPPALDRTLHTALEKDPGLRYQRMDGMLADLTQISRELESGILLKEASGVRRMTRQRMWRRIGLAGALALPLLALLAFTIAKLAPRWFPAVPSEKKIAVLPFRNVGGGKENDAFCDGLMESLTSELTELSQFHGSLWVVPASEVRRFASAREAQRALGVNLVITGSVQRDASHVHLTANLVDANSLRQLRSREVTRPAGELADLQGSVVQEIAGMLRLELGDKERQALSAGETSASGAYDLYLQARGYLQRRTQGDIDRAIGLFEQAISVDSKYALAYAGLGEAYWRKYRVTRDTQWTAPAESNCRRALELNRQLAPVYVTLGIIQQETGHSEEAIAALQKALQLEPTNASAVVELARVLEGTGKMADAEATFRKGAQLRPADWTILNDLGLFYYRRGRYGEAAPLFLKITSLTPDNSSGFTNLGAVYWANGNYEEAASSFKRSQELRPTASGYANLGTLYYFLGRCAEAVPLMEQASRLMPKNEQVWGNLGDAYSCDASNKDRAVQAYQRAIQLCEERLAVNREDAQVRSEVALYQARLGRKAEALANTRRARELAPGNRNVEWHAALVFELAGNREAALEALRSAIRAGQPLVEVRNEPTLAALRSDARYAGVVERGDRPEVRK